MSRSPLLLAGALFACTAAKAPEEPTRKPASMVPRRDPGAGVPALSAHRLTTVPQATYGPYLEAGSAGAVSVWAALDERGKRAWYGVALEANGKPRGAPKLLGPAPAELGVVALRAVDDEFLVLSSSSTQTATQISALWLGADAKALGKHTAVAESQGSVLWLEAFPTERGALVLWAAQNGKAADVYSAEVEMHAAARPPRLAASGVSAWQAVRTGRGIALATVVAPAQAAAGPVQLVLLEPTGSARGAPISVSAEKSASFDLDMIAVDDRLVLAWSDSRGVEPRVYLAAVDTSGKVLDAPKPALPPFGEQALVRLVPPYAARTPGYLVWEGMVQGGSAHRSLQIATIGSDGRVGPERAELSMASQDGSVPELEATARGLSALTLAPLCERGNPCSDEPRTPVFVDFDATLQPVAAEPLRLAPLGGEPAALAWSLECKLGSCLALSAFGSSPAPVFAVELGARSAAWRIPARKVVPGPAPRARELSAVAKVEPLSDIAAVRVAGKVLSGFVTYFDPGAPNVRLKTPAPDGRFDPVRARLEVRAYPEQGAPPPAQVLSLRARSLGGISMTATAGRDEALVGWTALDNGQPEVFVTLVSSNGHKLAQRMLTRRKGEISDVAVAGVADGFVVAWIDERSGDAEVYAARVNRGLQRVGAERRLTTSAGAASAVSLLGQGQEVVAVWADARQPDAPGAGDLYAMRLNAADAVPLGAEQRLTSTRANSHSPVLADVGDGLALAWIEAGLGSDEAEAAGLRLTRLARGALQPSPETRIVPSQGTPVAMALDCAASACHLVWVANTGAGSRLEGASVTADGRIAAQAPLVELGASAPETVPPALVGSTLFYADQSDGQAWLRQMTIDWQ